MITLANPSFLLIGVIFLPLLFKREDAFLGYSRMNLLEGEKGPRFFHPLSKLLLVLAIALMVLGFARPQWKSAVRQERFLARDILLVMDLSYSMETGFENEESMGPRKIDVAKSAAAKFIESRETDRIGLLVFGDETFGSWPLTRDLELITKKVNRLGSAFYGGTNLTKPLLKAVDHFREMGQSEKRILVFVSDGEATIPPWEKETIIDRLKKMDVHLYLVGVQLGKGSSDILEIVQAVGGKFIDVKSSAELEAAFKEINRLEPSLVELAVRGESQELYPLCILSALGILFSLTLLRNTFFLRLC
jgi:Ca-activated chloride channel family protein